MPETRIALSTDLTEDGIAAEVPGQSFENQPGQPAEQNAQARFGEAVRSGSCNASDTASWPNPSSVRSQSAVARRSCS